MAIMLLGSLTAYSVLVKDIWTPVILSLTPNDVRKMLLGSQTQEQFQDTSHDEQQHDSEDVGSTDRASAIVLAVILVLCSPLLLQRDLHSLRHTCYVGFSSCVLLLVAIILRTTQSFSDGGDGERSQQPINWYSTNVSDLSFAFPIVVLCFLCSYNVLSVHSSLQDPTRQRVKLVLDSSMMICFGLFYAVGLGGYLYARNETVDNILLNFPLDDSAILAGRVGFCLTLVFILPLILLPCREAFLQIIPQLKSWRVDTALIHEFEKVDDEQRLHGAHLVINGVDFDESFPLLVSDDPTKQHATMLTYGTNHSKEHVLGSPSTIMKGDSEDLGTNSTTRSSVSTFELNDDHEYQLRRTRNCGPGDCICKGNDYNVHDTDATDHQACTMTKFWYTSSTLFIVVFSYYAAIKVPGVGFVWSLLGSSMAILIAFIIPCSCYLKIREHKQRNPRSVAAWIILIISVLAAPICTRQALIQKG
mmetsp:Transcript_18862/g.45563  ORF Transcript_18862/g.45563 Transcript_18862/m.45563 type:complete len:475 (+) Transcript_18862:457-1881(+)